MISSIVACWRPEAKRWISPAVALGSRRARAQNSGEVCGETKGELWGSYWRRWGRKRGGVCPRKKSTVAANSVAEGGQIDGWRDRVGEQMFDESGGDQPPDLSGAGFGGGKQVPLQCRERHDGQAVVV